jgi:outer membrane lipoprotein-sorting protein
MLGSMIGTVHLDVHDKRALDDSRHPITEVGLGHIIEQATHAMRDGQATSPGPAVDAVDGAPAFRFELTRTGGGALFGIKGAERASIWVDASQKLPVKVVIVDGAGAMLERHRFKELRINVGLTDQTFTL